MSEQAEVSQVEFSPWSEAECSVGCGFLSLTKGDALTMALRHVAKTGHETAVIEHRSTHYRRIAAEPETT